MAAVLSGRNTLKIDDVRQAASRIRPYIRRTPIIDGGLVSDRLGTNVYLKLELLQKTGAFKVRGAFNKILTLNNEEKKQGIVAVSAGNHAQAVAYAARELGQKALILMPESTPQNYINKTKNYGAEIRFFPSLADAFVAAGEYQAAGRVYVHPFDDAQVIAGQGTLGLEILEDVPDVTDIIVSVGGGGLSCGIALAVKSVKPDVNVWGVETKGADSMAKALEAGRIVELAEITSIAKTLGAPEVGQLTFELAKKYLSGITVVDDREAISELFYLLDNVKVLTEPAASCTLAAAERLRENFGKSSNVVLVLCGGNIGMDIFSLSGMITKNCG
jgi:threonine dehydratase